MVALIGSTLLCVLFEYPILQQLPEYVRATWLRSVNIDYRNLAQEADKICLTGRDKHTRNQVLYLSKTLLPMMCVGITLPLARKNQNNMPNRTKNITCTAKNMLVNMYQN